MDDPGQWHLYTYCANNPINYVDPSGHVAAALYKLWISLGFTWDSEQEIFYTKKDCLQYKLGYCDAYDRIGDMFVDINTAKSIFKYDGKWWRIQMWKGRYGLTNGGELGIYTGNSKNGWFRCAKKEDMLNMNITLKNTYSGKELFTRTSGKGTHWWLCGFKPGKRMKIKNLQLSGNITFKSKEMANKFVNNVSSSVSAKRETKKRVKFTW